MGLQKEEWLVKMNIYPYSFSITSLSAQHCWRRISSIPSPIRRPWSPDRNSSFPWSATARCPVMTQGTVHFTPTISVGSGRAIPACLNGRLVIALPGIWYVYPLKMSISHWVFWCGTTCFTIQIHWFFLIAPSRKLKLNQTKNNIPDQVGK